MTTPTESIADRLEMLGLESLEELLGERRELVATVAPLRARYGAGGTWDARRKAHRSAIANVLAAELEVKRGKKPAEDEVERLAAAHEDVGRLLDVAEEDMAKLAILENDIASISERIKNRQGELFYLGAEARLGG